MGGHSRQRSRQRECNPRPSTQTAIDILLLIGATRLLPAAAQLSRQPVVLAHRADLTPVLMADEVRANDWKSCRQPDHCVRSAGWSARI
ncbi:MULTISPECIES: hypothetical protein [Fischerella]|uniref:hypothetical protein n=1 Tax=Fischerella sp. FACHB-380 TaxID=2692799 RepID=UPI001F2E7D4D|nr:MULTISPECIES: hypothetical protein [Fischerella]